MIIYIMITGYLAPASTMLLPAQPSTDEGTKRGETPTFFVFSALALEARAGFRGLACSHKYTDTHTHTNRPLFLLCHDVMPC